MLPKLHIKLERWKYNRTFEVYVSNMGHICNKSKATLAPKIVKDGYIAVHVQGSNPKYILVHRLVMLTWRPTPEAEQLTVDHLDHNKRNNALDNLEWVSFKENLRRAQKDLAPAKANQEVGLSLRAKQPKRIIGVSVIDQDNTTINIMNTVPDEAIPEMITNMRIDKNFNIDKFRLYLNNIRIQKICTYQTKKYCGLQMKAILA